MKYQMTIKRDGDYADLVFTRKNGEVDEIYLGLVKDGALGDRVLGKLYDFHQTDDEFEGDDQMSVEGVGNFSVLEKIHIVPADEETRLAVQGLTKELPYRISYEGIDGNASRSFASIDLAAAYVKERWQGVDYMDGASAFHTDYARYLLFGFKLADIGTMRGTSREDRWFEFNEVKA